MVGSVVETAAAEERLVELPLAVSASLLPWQLATNWLSDWPVGVKMNGLHSHSLSLSLFLSLSLPSFYSTPSHLLSLLPFNAHTHIHTQLCTTTFHLTLPPSMYTHTHTHPLHPSTTPHPHPLYFTHTHTHNTQPSTIPHTHPQPTCSSPGLPAPPCTP